MGAEGFGKLRTHRPCIPDSVNPTLDTLWQLLVGRFASGLDSYRARGGFFLFGLQQNDIGIEA